MSLHRLIRGLYDWVRDRISEEPLELRLNGGGYLITEEWGKKGVKLQSLRGSEAVYQEHGFICLVRIVDFAFSGTPRIWLQVERNFVSVSYPPPNVGEQFEVGSSAPYFHITDYCFSSSVQLGYWGVYFDGKLVNQAKALDLESEAGTLTERYYRFTDLLNNAGLHDDKSPDAD